MELVRLGTGQASAFVRTAAGTRRTSKAPLFLAPTLFVPDDPAFSDAASTSSAIPTHKDTSTVLPPPVDGQGESRRSSQLDIPNIDTIDIMINTAFCNFIPISSITARAFSLLHFTYFYLKAPVSFLRRKRQQEYKRSYPLFFKPLKMLIGQGTSRLTARYCLSFLILTKDLSTHLAFISNLSYFYVRKRIFIRHSESCLFLRKKETTFFLSSFILNIFHFISFFTFSFISLFVFFTNHYSFNISDLLSGKARTKPHDTRRGAY